MENLKFGSQAIDTSLNR